LSVQEKASNRCTVATTDKPKPQFIPQTTARRPTIACKNQKQCQDV